MTLDMNKQECNAHLNHDYTSTQVVQSQTNPRVTILWGGGGGQQFEFIIVYPKFPCNLSLSYSHFSMVSNHRRYTGELFTGISKVSHNGIAIRNLSAIVAMRGVELSNHRKECKWTAAYHIILTDYVFLFNSYVYQTYIDNH